MVPDKNKCVAFLPRSPKILLLCHYTEKQKRKTRNVNTVNHQTILTSDQYINHLPNKSDHPIYRHFDFPLFGFIEGGIV